MNTLISAKQLRASLPRVVQSVKRGRRFTVLYRSRPAFQVVPIEAECAPMPPLKLDPIYRAKAVGRSKDGRTAADHDRFLYAR